MRRKRVVVPRRQEPQQLGAPPAQPSQQVPEAEQGPRHDDDDGQPQPEGRPRIEEARQPQDHLEDVEQAPAPQHLDEPQQQQQQQPEVVAQAAPPAPQDLERQQHPQQHAELVAQAATAAPESQQVDEAGRKRLLQQQLEEVKRLRQFQQQAEEAKQQQQEQQQLGAPPSPPHCLDPALPKQAEQQAEGQQHLQGSPELSQQQQSGQQQVEQAVQQQQQQKLSEQQPAQGSGAQQPQEAGHRESPQEQPALAMPAVDSAPVAADEPAAATPAVPAPAAAAPAGATPKAAAAPEAAAPATAVVAVAAVSPPTRELPRPPPPPGSAVKAIPPHPTRLAAAPPPPTGLAAAPGAVAIHNLPSRGVATLQPGTRPADFCAALAAALGRHPHASCHFDNIDVSKVGWSSAEFQELIGIVQRHAATAQRIKALVGDPFWGACLCVAFDPPVVHGPRSAQARAPGQASVELASVQEVDRATRQPTCGGSRAHRKSR